MRKLYILTLCCTLCAGAAGAHQRFVSKRPIDKSQPALSMAAKKDGKLIVKAPAASPAAIWRPATQTEYYYNGADWDEMGTANFKYDSRGNTIEESYEEDGNVNTTVNTYDANNELTSLLTTVTTDEGTQNVEKRTYAYDPIVTDFYTERMGYNWQNNAWVENYYCEKNEITRDGNRHITQIVKQLKLDNAFIPAYKSAWTYDATGKAVEFAYYVNYNANNTEEWLLDDELSYKDIQWENTDGQMTDHINEMLEGANRVKQYSVYYDGELDGHVFVEYSTTNPGDFVMKQTYADPTEVGIIEKVETIDANGSIRITETEYFDEDGNITATPSYEAVETILYDEHGSVISDELTEAYEGGGAELVMGAKSAITYDPNGNPTEVIMSSYNYDEGEYMPESRIVYGEYTDVSLGINDITAADENAPVIYYNLQGVRVDNPESGLYIMRQGNNVSKVYLNR